MWLLRCTIGENWQPSSLNVISVLKTMKRIESPLQASIRLDAFNSPITLTGNSALQVQSPLWLRVTYTCLTKPLTPLASFFPVFKSFPGYDHFIKNSIGATASAYFRSLHKIKTINLTRID
jgi:hypothetical protein